MLFYHKLLVIVNIGEVCVIYIRISAVVACRITAVWLSTVHIGSAALRSSLLIKLGSCIVKSLLEVFLSCADECGIVL